MWGRVYMSVRARSKCVVVCALPEVTFVLMRNETNGMKYFQCLHLRFTQLLGTC